MHVLPRRLQEGLNLVRADMTAGPLLPATGGAAGLVRAPLVPAVAPAGGAKGPRERGEGGERKSANGAEGTGTNGVPKGGEKRGEGRRGKRKNGHGNVK